MPRGEIPLLFHHLERKGGRRERERQTNEESRPATAPTNSAAARASGSAVRATCAPPSRKMPWRMAQRRLRAKFQADQKQQENDAEFREFEDFVGFVLEKTWRMPWGPSAMPATR